MSKHHSHDHELACAVTYDALRTALVRPDVLSNETIRMLTTRVTKAAIESNREPIRTHTRQANVLFAYAAFLRAVLEERLLLKT